MTNRDFDEKLAILYCFHGNEILSAQEISELTNMSTQRAVAILNILELDNLIYEVNINRKIYYSTKKETCDKAYNRAYPLDYRVYRKLINFIKNWKKSIDERRKVW